MQITTEAFENIEVRRATVVYLGERVAAKVGQFTPIDNPSWSIVRDKNGEAVARQVRARGYAWKPRPSTEWLDFLFEKARKAGVIL